MIDLLTPFAVIGAAAAALVSLEARGRDPGRGLVAAILYVDGHGIHLSANSIAQRGPRPEAEDLVHFWDETFSHIEAVIGWFGLVACFCWAEQRHRAGAGGPSSRTGRIVRDGAPARLDLLHQHGRGRDLAHRARRDGAASCSGSGPTAESGRCCSLRRGAFVLAAAMIGATPSGRAGCRSSQTRACSRAWGDACFDGIGQAPIADGRGMGTD